MRLFGVAVLCVALCGCSEGVAPLLSQAKPETVINFDPISRTIHVHNSKDVDVTIESARYVGKDGDTFELNGLAFRDNASIVRQANVAQLQASAPLMAEAVRPLTTFMGIVGDRLGVAIANQPGSVTTQPANPEE